MNAQKVIFFDGECGLCNRIVDWLMRTDKSEQFFFSALQSPFAKRFFKDRNLHIEVFDTIYFYHNQQLYDKGTAVKQLLLDLPGAWHYLGRLTAWVPKFIADYLYELVAANRFRLFGKTSCRVPTPEERNRFLEH